MQKQTTGGVMLIDFSPTPLRKAFFGFLLAGVAMPATAGEGWPNFSLRGFGTLGAVYHDDDGVRFRRDLSQAGGAKAGQISLVQDSMVGAQLTVFAHQQLEFSAQAIARQTVENNFDPTLTWGYLKYKPDDGMALRLGRLGIETYIQGDSAEIGYANLLIRQPIIFYPRIFDGMDAEINYQLGGGNVRLKGFAGWTQGEVFNYGTIYDTGGSVLFGGILEYAWNGWTGRYSIGQLNDRDQVDSIKADTPLANALQALPNGKAIYDVVSLQHRKIDFQTFALAYDDGPIQGLASYSLVASPHWPDRHLFYANFGYRLGSFTPYIAYSFQHARREFVATGLPSGVGFDIVNETAAWLQSTILVNQSNLALGVRYDFFENMALKFQTDFTRYQDPESIFDDGLSLGAGSAQTRGSKSLTMFSLALDFVF